MSNPTCELSYGSVGAVTIALIYLLLLLFFFMVVVVVFVVDDGYYVVGFVFVISLNFPFKVWLKLSQ